MFYSAMTVSAAKQISLFTTGSHLRDKSLNVRFGKGELERGSIYVTVSRRGVDVQEGCRCGGGGHRMQLSNKGAERQK